MNLNKLFAAGLAIFALASCHQASDPYMELETKLLSLDSEGGTATVTLSSNVYYRVNNDCSDDSGEHWWARISDTEVSGDQSVFHFEVDANESTEERTGIVRFIGDGVTPLKLTLKQKGIVPKGIAPESATVESSAVSASFKVYGDRNWTATCSDADVVISPASGFGEADVTVTFPENEELTDRIVTVHVALEGDKTYDFTLTHKGFSGVLADWNLNALTAETGETFCDDADQTVFPGTNGKFLKSSEGKGKIEYYAADRTGYAANKVVCQRLVGANGDPYVSGAIPEDYWLITVDKKIPAGTKIHYRFVTKMGTATSSYWLMEYKSGDGWKPTVATSTRSEKAEKGLTGNAVSYSKTITYNFAATLLDAKKNGAYVAVDATFTTDKELDALVLRFGQAGHLGLDGSKNDGIYTDRTDAGGQTRFSAQRPSTEDGTAVKTYDQHVTIEIAK